MLSLNELWFVLVALLFVGFFFLEGFDFGVGISTRFLTNRAEERRLLINTIGPFWDANEVWLITAGGAMFAAFPHWYATLLSGYYVPLAILLLALICRGVAFEFRSKLESSRWRKSWDQVIFISSILPPFLLGIVFAGFLKGLPIDQQMEMQAGWSDILNVYTIWGGVTVTMLCWVHGLLFLTLRTVGSLRDRARQMAKRLWFPLAGCLLIFTLLTIRQTDVFQVRSEMIWGISILSALCLILARVLIVKNKDGWAFTMMGLVMIFTISAVFIGLFPRVMISTLDPAFHLTVENASSGSYSLKVMTIVASTLLPFVLGYQIWNYYVFRKRVSEKEPLEY